MSVSSRATSLYFCVVVCFVLLFVCWVRCSSTLLLLLVSFTVGYLSSHVTSFHPPCRRSRTSTRSRASPSSTPTSPLAHSLRGQNTATEHREAQPDTRIQQHTYNKSTNTPHTHHVWCMCIEPPSCLLSLCGPCVPFFALVDLSWRQLRSASTPSPTHTPS